MIFKGDKLFHLKATHGIPLDLCLAKIILAQGLSVSWADFVEEARKNKRWDFQIYEDVKVALEDAVIDKAISEEILLRLRLYILRTAKDSNG